MSASASTTRPPTSKPRGVCRYYIHPRGCFAGDNCKFLHGEPSQATPDRPLLTPYDKSKKCRYYLNGFCRRGDKCWFLHVSEDSVQGKASEKVKEPSDDQSCAICFEEPVTFGLLSGCSHVFCITCIRQWRDPNGKAGDMVDSGNTKKCPMCRTPSKFITPSSRFFKQEDPEKEKIVQAYKESMAKVPCRYFKQSKQKDKSNPLCPFGKDCFYQHLNDDGTPYVFKDGVDVCMRQHRSRNSRIPHFFPFPLSFDGDFGGLNFFFNSSEMDLTVPWRRAESSNPNNATSRAVSAVRRLRDLSRSLEAINNVISDNVDAEALSAAVEAMRRGLSSLDEGNRTQRRRRSNPDNLGDIEDDEDEEDAEENEVMERLELLADEMLVSLNNFQVNTDPESDESESLPLLEPFVSAPDEPTQSNVDNTNASSLARHFRWATRDDDDNDGDLPSLQSVSNSSDDDNDSERDDNDNGDDPTDDEESVGHPRAHDTAYNAIDNVREERARERLERLGRTWPLFQFLGAAGASSSHEEHMPDPLARDNALQTDVDDGDDTQEDVDEDDPPPLELIAPPSVAQEPSLTLVSEPPFVTDGRGRVVGASPGPARSISNNLSTPLPMPSAISSRPSQRRKPSTPATEPPDGSGEFMTDGRGRVVSVGSGNAASGSSSAEGNSTSEQSSPTSGSEAQRSFIGRMLDALF